jgi:L-fucose isomerase
MKTNPPTNPLIGAMPKIGIRPTIDGRLGGVREGLEHQTMTMARNVAKFLSDNLRHYNGLPVECVIADSTIGGVAEAAACAEKFRREGVGVSLTVTPCWCYGSETMDMDPHLPKAVWGFNGTERPGAVYLAAVSAAHNQKGLPVFNIYGRDVQDGGDTSIPADVQEKLLRFAKAGLAVASMRGKSYLSMGGVSMGIAGSIVNHDFLERWLGHARRDRSTWWSLCAAWRRHLRPGRIRAGLRLGAANCPEGKDYNPPEKQRSRAQKGRRLGEVGQDGADRPRPDDRQPEAGKEMGFGEEAHGHNAIASGFQGQRQWTDHLPNGDFLEAILTSSFDWNGIRPPYIVATENDALNGISMLFGHLLTDAAAMIFADVRTYWSADAVKRVTGYQLEGGLPAASCT